ncbi:unnamed protein product [Gongylonema pulchrum]|uniref:Protein kinase domain-containing protein n=1 Tax=Gongylonema pulchrum TaxID=637853 RepID=A0A183EJW5_9BILA|nr:unnamed protein product [Gongylonema pulchrum]
MGFFADQHLYAGSLKPTSTTDIPHSCTINFSKLEGQYVAGARPHVQPFDGMVDSDPTFEQMCRVVCVQGKRPLLEDEWKRDVIINIPCLKDICDLISECWSTNIDCRHTALRMKRKIRDTLLKYQMNIYQNSDLFKRDTRLPNAKGISSV